MPESFTLREAIARTVLGRLRAALAPVPVYRNRNTVLDVSEAPIVVFFEAGHTAEQTDYGETAYTMSLPFEGTVTADSTDEIGAEMDGLYKRILRALMADPTLNGLCQQLREVSLDPRGAMAEESEKPLMSFSLDIVAEFHAADGAPMPWQDAAPAPLPGDAGGTDDTGTVGPAVGSKYRHVQATPSATWIIRHNLAHYPNYVVVDTAGNRIHPGGESYPDSNTVILGFGVPYSGTADLD